MTRKNLSVRIFSMLTIINMKKEHLEKVNEIYSKAYSVGRIVEGIRDHEVPLYELRTLEFLLNASSQGAFVGSVKRKMVSYLFSRLWGSLGWLGPLGVLPAYQGKGYGKSIIRKGIDFLKKSGASTIGLEISPRSNANIGLYLSLGFREAYLNVEFSKKIPIAPSKGRPSKETFIHEMGKLSQAEQRDVLDKVEKLSRSVFNGLVLTGEVENTLRSEMGEAFLVYAEGVPKAFFTCHLAPHFQGEILEVLKVRNFMSVEDRRARIYRSTISFLNRYGRKRGFSYLSFTVPLNLWEDCSYFLTEGFKVSQSSLRMVLDGFPEQAGGEGVLLSEWQE